MNRKYCVAFVVICIILFIVRFGKPQYRNLRTVRNEQLKEELDATRTPKDSVNPQPVVYETTVEETDAIHTPNYKNGPVYEPSIEEEISMGKLQDNGHHECLQAQAREAMLFDPLNPPPPAEARHRGKKVPFTLPWAESVPVEEALQLQWVRDLQYFLTTAQPKWPIAVVGGDGHYVDVILNWLIAALVKADDPIKNVLVVSIDISLQQILRRRGLASLYIPPHCLSRVDPSINRKYYNRTRVEIPRITVMRILNYWGYDVANYDGDAIIVKNPQPLYNKLKKSDIVGGFGRTPTQFVKSWGATLNMGVVLFRATYLTGENLLVISLIEMCIS